MSRHPSSRVTPPTLVALTLVLIGVGADGLSRADDQDAIDYRQHIMRTMDEDLGAIRQILNGQIGPDSLATHAQILAVTASTAKMAFTAKIPGGKSKPDVWAKGPDFAQRLDKLTAATADLANAAKQGGVAATTPKLEAALGCKGCHDVYMSSPAQRATPDSKSAIEYREHIMNALNEQSGALGEILSTAIADDNAPAHLEVIALGASIALKAFEPKIPGGEAKPDVWTHWPDFSKRMNEFAQKTAQSVKRAKEQGKEAALSNILDALTCKDCHDVYREEKKK